MTKPNKSVSDHDEITLIADAAAAWVSRAALKLIAALEAFGVDVAGKKALDLGASTGGFTQVLLAHGAAHVVALDVGHGQLAAEIAGDERVTVMERFNARDLAPGHLPFAPEVLTCDLSFISLKKALPPALALAAPGALLIALIKPQFEVGRQSIGKGGIVKDEAQVRQVLADIPAWLAQDHGARVEGPVPSPIKGADGNQEYLIQAVLP